MSDKSTGGGALNVVLKLITEGIRSGGKTRRDLLTSASQMASTIQMTSAVCVARLSTALMARSVSEKREILTKLTNDEILQMGRVNQLCDPIASAANQLNHALSLEWANVNIGSHDLARHAFQTLQDREWGLQKLFTESIGATVADADLDNWLKDKIRELTEMGDAATNAVRILTNAI